MSADAPIKLLMVEDDARLAKFTAEYLKKQGILVTIAATGPEGLQEAGARQYDVILLDLSIPGKDGLEVCRAMRARSDVPVIIVTARLEEADRLVGFEAGADDYVTKPFSAPELLSRVRAVVRRARGQVGPRKGTLNVGDLQIDSQSMRVTLKGNDIAVTSYEFEILRVLAEQAGRVLSREQLLDLAKRGGADEAFERSIDVRISRLRQKLGDDPRNPRLLKTIRGVGYLLAVAEES
jgi:two-component system, OmpR family, response regulator